MGDKFTDFAYGIGGQAAGIGMGLLLGDYNDRRQLEQQAKLQELQMSGSKKMMDYQMAKQLEMWKATSYKAQIEQMMKAGLNPGLMYGMSGGGGQTTGSTSASTAGGTAPTGGREIPDMLGMGIQYQLLKAQKENIEAQTEKTKGETVNLPKTGSNIDADTANKIAQGILLKFGGQEAERQWNINKELSTEEYGAKADEFEARKAVAAQIVKLHEDGTMQKLTDTELNKKIQELAQGKLQIEGKKLENAILELEKKMQETLGLDKNSPAWMRIIGRLIMGFMK